MTRLVHAATRLRILSRRASSAMLTLLLLLAAALPAARGAGLLHPQDSESREVKSLDGLWRFKLDPAAAGLRDRWYAAGLPEPTRPMAVPSSYNELTQDGSGSDPSSGFKACASLGGGMVDLTRGTTKNIEATAAYGGSTGWSEKGYNPAGSMPFWGYFMFWSNTTAA